jgi:hypothetical protein
VQQGEYSGVPKLSVFLSVNVLYIEVSEIPYRSVHDELSVILQYRGIETEQQERREDN